jgi:hypothetical protein
MDYSSLVVRSSMVVAPCVALRGWVVRPALPIMVAAVLASPVGAQEAAATRSHESLRAGLRFEVPSDSRVFERDLHMDQGVPEPTTAVVLRIVPAGMSEEASLASGTQVFIEARDFAEPPSLDDWIVRLHPGGAPPAATSGASVAGQPAVRLDLRDEADGGDRVEVLFVAGRRGYRLASGPEGRGEEVLALILASARLLDEAAADVPKQDRPPTPPRADPPAAGEPPVVRVIYLKPSDRFPNNPMRQGLERSIRDLQAHFHGELQGKTFLLPTPIVQLVPTPHPVSWYQNNPSAPFDQRFFQNVIADAFALTGAIYNDPLNRWIFAIDADPLCGQITGGGAGIAVLPANDLRGNACATNIPPCGPPPDAGKLCRWYGGMGHELGHAFLLPHPASCPAPDSSCSRALMWTGYAAYPSAYLLPGEKSSLLTHPSTQHFFFAGIVPDPASPRCSFSCTQVRMDAHPFVGTVSNLNGVMEPQEACGFETQWTAAGATFTLTGTASQFTGPGPAIYSVPDPFADYGTIPDGWTNNCFESTANCYRLGVVPQGPRPATHWDGTVRETLSGGAQKTWTIHVGGSFADVPPSSPYYRFVETLLHRGITGGCGGDQFCPQAPTSRAAMAVFTLRALEGPTYTPPACTGPVRMFSDVPASSPFCPWVEEWARRGVTGGCSLDQFCPDAPVTREQQAVFLLRTREGSSYAPPPCSGSWRRFVDVPVSSPFCPWIEELARRSITTGCGPGSYCPSADVTREQMAVFLTETFALTLYSH